MSKKIDLPLPVGQRVRLVRTLKEPDGPLVEARLVYDGLVSGSDARRVFLGDHFVVPLADARWDVEITEGEWPPGTIAYVDIEKAGEDEVEADVLVRRDRWGQSWERIDETFGRYAQFDLDSGEIRFENFRLIHDGKVPA